MGRQVLHHANVCDARRERALTTSRYLIDVAQVSCFDTLSQALKSRVEPLDVTNRTDTPLCLERLDDSSPSGYIHCDRLFDQSVHSGSGELECDDLMEFGRYRDNRGVDSDRDQVPDGRADLEVTRDPKWIAELVGDTD
jgi:hypothetical protein